MFIVVGFVFVSSKRFRMTDKTKTNESRKLVQCIWKCEKKEIGQRDLHGTAGKAMKQTRLCCCIMFVVYVRAKYSIERINTEQCITNISVLSSVFSHCKQFSGLCMRPIGLQWPYIVCTQLFLFILFDSIL